MLSLGFRFDEDAIVLDAVAHRSDCPLLPMPLPREARLLSAGEVLRAQRCPWECTCAPPFETMLGYHLDSANRSWTLL